SPIGKSDTSILNLTRKAQTSIQCRNRGWSLAVLASTLRTAAFIVTANRCAPITQAPISNGSGAIAAARPAITFSNDRFSSGRCVWVRILPTSVHAHQRKRKALRPPVVVRALHRKERRSPVRHLLPQARLQRRRQRPPVLLYRSRRRPQLPRRLRAHQRRRDLQSQAPAQVSLRLLRERPLLQLQVLVHRPWRDHRGPSRRRASRRFTRLLGIMYIFTRRAVSTSIRTCRPIVFSTELAVSMTRVRRMHCSLPVPMPRPRDGRSFQLTMRNVLWPI